MTAKIYRTCKLNNEKLADLGSFEFTDEQFTLDTLKQKANDTEQRLINLHPQAEFDKFEGFGAALTETAATAWMRMDEEKRNELIRAYFSVDDGIGYTVGRIHLNSCDFSVNEYSYVEEGDMTLDSFNISREDVAVIPMIKAAMAYAKDLKIFASPWSPPKYMKDNNSIQGGYLRPDCYGLWAEYIRKFVAEMKKRGVELWGLTVQNETRHHQSWESCCYTPEQEMDFVKNHLGPALDGLGLNIFVYDHCKERIFERSMQYYNDPIVKKYVAGIACHWYSGDHFGEIELCRRLYPDKKVIMSEGCTFHPEKGFGNHQWELAEKYVHDITGSLNAGLTCFVDWNITLDENNGPCHNRDGRNLCDAAIFCDTANQTLYYHPNYYFIGQFSKFIRPGAVRIGHSCYTAALETTAFKNPDGSIAVVVYNKAACEISYIIRINGKLLNRKAPPHSVETIVFTED